MYTQSLKAFEQARKVIPGGVNSPVRSFSSIQGNPVFIKKASGDTLTDLDNNKYIDYCLSWGVHILGHAPKTTINAVEKALKNSTSYGIPTTLETTLAEKLVEAVPSIEMVRLVNSGTEAVMSAIRLARGYTGRNKIVKFDGCYHGHADHLLVSAGSGVASLSNSSSKGIPDDFTKHTLSLPFNDEFVLSEVFSKHGTDIAAVIVEPVPANMGVVLPKNGFLKLLRNLATKYGSVLIFDEVITGFRPCFGGAQEYFDIKPDITTLGKIIGGGFPIGTYGGKKEIMLHVAPAGEVYQAGTLAGNPIAVSAGIATIDQLSQDDFYEKLNKKSNNFINELSEIVKNYGGSVNSFKNMFTLFFTPEPPKCYTDVKKCDSERFAKFYKKLLEKGIYFSPSQFEANFISIAHSNATLNNTLEIIENTLHNL